jgi:hypothetical protein
MKGLLSLFIVMMVVAVLTSCVKKEDPAPKQPTPNPSKAY